MAVLDQLGRVCNDFPVEEKWLVVPQPQLGGTLLAGLSKVGKAWFNVRVHTLDQLLNSLFALPEACPPAMYSFWEVASELPSDVLGTLDRLRCSGADEARIPLLPHLTKRQILNDALTVSEEMRVKGAASRYHFYKDALQWVEKSPPLNGVLVVLGTLEVNTLEAELLRALAAKATHLEVLHEPGALIPGTAAAALLSHPAEEDNITVPETLFVRAVSPESEVYAVLQTIQEYGMALEDVEIAMAQPNLYHDVVRAVCARAKVPLSVSMGTPVNQTRVGQLVESLGKLVTQRRDGVHPLLNVLRSGFSPKSLFKDVKNERASQKLVCLVPTSGYDLPPTAYLRHLAARGVEKLNLSYDEAVQYVEALLTQDVPEKSEIKKEEVTVLKGLRAWYEAFPESFTTFGHLVHLLRSWLTRAVDEETRRGEVSTERSAYNRVLSRLSGVEERVGQVRVSAEQGMETLLGYLLQGNVEGQMPKAGHVHLVALPFAGLSGRPIRFVLGLDDGVRWATSGQDRWLRREDRELLGADAVDSEERAKQVAHRALKRPGTHQILSYAVLDLADSSERAPSPVYLEALRTTFGAASEDILHQHARFVDLLPQRTRAYHENDELLAVPDATHIQRAFPQTARGVQGHTERIGDEPSAFNGTLGLPLDAQYDPFGTPEKPTSATRLNTLVQSGFASFLRDVLCVKLSEEDQGRDAGWPTALMRGLAVHELLKNVVDSPEIDPATRVEDYLQRVSKRLPPPDEAAYETFRQYLLRMLKVFITLEASLPAHTRKHTEVELKPLDEKGLLVPLSEEVMLYMTGRIDRLDLTPHGGSVIDYKTGQAKTFIEKKDWLKAGELQWAIYALAASRKFGHPVHQAGYVFLSEQHLGLKLMRDVPEKELLAQVLQHARRAFMEGYLTHTKDATPLIYAPESWVRPPQKNPLPEYD